MARVAQALQQTSIQLYRPDRAEQITCTFAVGEPGSASTLIVFLNGLILPREPWHAVMSRIITACSETNVACPAMLAYDRFGQGDSSPNPDGDYRDIPNALSDLLEVMKWFKQTHIRDQSESGISIVFVANSIGCALARLFRWPYANHSSRSHGLVFLDSIIANSDMVSLFPDPDAADFDGDELPKGVDVAMLRHARKAYRENFHPSLPNPEGLDRSDLPRLLPDADKPRPCSWSDQPPYVVVVGSDPEVMAASMEQGRLQIPRQVFLEYHSKAWKSYNEGLARLTVPERSVGPLVATGCNHFIQQDDPEYVAGLVVNLIKAMRNGSFEL